jgi:flagellin-specific chaperone FliS
MSQQTVRQNYIQADVLSATPQKLQLLLVEAAI